jgi:hypothetical protein
MNYNFTNGMRLVMAMAREEANRLQHDYIGTEHLLLGLIRESDGAGCAILDQMGIDPETIIVDVESSVLRGRAILTPGEFPYTTPAKTALLLATETAKELNHEEVGTDHLLCGLVREGKGIAAEVLRQHAVAPEGVVELTSRFRSGAGGDPVGARSDTRSTRFRAPSRLGGELVREQKQPQHVAPWKHAGTDAQPNSAIFISYRRADDVGYIAGRIYDRLVAEFGEVSVFRDFDSIPLGVDFKQHLEQAVEKCSVFLAVINPGWDERLQNTRDFVRIELEAALRRDIPIIPLFVLRATMPEETNLPPSLHPLIYRNGTEIRPDPDFSNDMQRLIAAIRRVVGTPRAGLKS